MSFKFLKKIILSSGIKGKVSTSNNINPYSILIFRFLVLSNLISSLHFLKLNLIFAEFIPDLEYLLSLFSPYSGLWIELSSSLESSRSVALADLWKESQKLYSPESRKNYDKITNDMQRWIEAHTVVDEIRNVCRERFCHKFKADKIDVPVLKIQDISDVDTEEVEDRDEVSESERWEERKDEGERMSEVASGGTGGDARSSSKM